MRLDGSDPAAIEAGAQRLAEGGLVAFATETVYGLGARADDDAAVAGIFAAKGRPADHPLIVHVADAPGAATFADPLPPLAQRLIEAFWPGPLTLIVPRRPGIATGAAAGAGTIGLRCPSHPVAQALLKAARHHGVPGVAAPSANRFGRVSPTLAEHVTEEFGEELLVLDGGPSEVGIESSIVDCTRGRPVLLRPGQLDRSRLEEAAGMPLDDPKDDDTDTPKASGTLESHYAPDATVRLMEGGMLKTALQVLGDAPVQVAVYSRSVPLDTAPGVRHRRMPNQPEAAAHELFAVLRALDAEGARLIWVEEPPSDAAWDGVRDRLHRAAAPKREQG